MNIDELIRDSLAEQAAEQQSPVPAFADRALSVRHRRARTLASLAAVTSAAVALSIAVPMLDSGKGDAPPQRSSKHAVPHPRFSQFNVPIPHFDGDNSPLASNRDQGDVITQPDQSPPRDLIAAGGTALAAYYTSSVDKQNADKGVTRRTYRILDQKTGTYRKDTRWSFIDVAPGLRTAAVLEQSLPVKRIGLLDLLTGKVEGWIPLDRGVASVAFSPDGGKLVATTYATNPDLVVRPHHDVDDDGKNNDWIPKWDQSRRTGFYILDMASGKGSWCPALFESKIPVLFARQDFDFSSDGTLVHSRRVGAPGYQFFDLKGNKVAASAKERYLPDSVEGGLSPDGRLTAEGTTILDSRTGKQLQKTPGERLIAWADNKRLIAWDNTPNANEFHSRLVLVTIGNDKTLPLSGFLQGDGEDAPERWTPLFTER
ncbi:WD40 repeat domain-containing protein [Streptomyces sp. Tue6028]|uniref:WD40 repeat domain-containing protein n=1 Tax=Streptomyces sp. Tue6028 TaxID=2036037 RepID=UPI003D74DD18